MAENWFLKIDGIDGESTDATHKNEIDVVSWSWGVSQTGPGPGAGGGGGAGKAAFQDFQFVARLSKASPKLFLSAATGTHHGWAALTGVKTAAKGQMAEFLKYKLSDVIVSSVQHAGGEGAELTEQFSLNYSKFEISYSQSSPSGKLAPPVEAGFELKQNKKV